MSKKIKSFNFILIIFIALFLTGCWDNEELDTISIVTGVGIDAADTEGNIKLSLQVGKINQEKSTPQSAGGSDDSIILEIEEKSILTGTNELERQVTRALFMFHNQVIIFGKEQAKKEIKPYIETFIRQNDMRMETLVFISEGEAKDILDIKMEQDKISSFGITKMIEGIQRYDETYSIRVLDLVCMIMDEGTTPVLPILKIEGSDKSRLLLKGLAILDNEKYIGELNETETRGYTWIRGKFKNTFIEVDTEDGLAILNMSNIRYKLKPQIKGEDLIMDLEILGDVVFSEVQGFHNMTIEETTKIILEGAKEKINEEIEASLSKSKKLKTDFLGFGTEYHKRFPKVWEDVKEHWENIFPEISLITNIELNLIDTGKIRNSLDMKEGK
ncbi:MAG: Ger(x)C family spore germination protein [Tissierella sp.]|nr:Ger(x)C family spore germination protein [Tissierella sp.]